MSAYQPGGDVFAEPWLQTTLPGMPPVDWSDAIQDELPMDEVA